MPTGPRLLRPATPETQGPHPQGATQQHLRPDRRWATLRDLLHQDRQPGPTTTHGRRPDPRTTTRQTEPTNPRTGRHRLPDQREPAHLKTRLTCKALRDQGSLDLTGLRPIPECML